MRWPLIAAGTALAVGVVALAFFVGRETAPTQPSRIVVIRSAPTTTVAPTTTTSVIPTTTTVAPTTSALPPATTTTSAYPATGLTPPCAPGNSATLFQAPLANGAPATYFFSTGTSDTAFCYTLSVSNPAAFPVLNPCSFGGGFRYGPLTFYTGQAIGSVRFSV